MAHQSRAQWPMLGGHLPLPGSPASAAAAGPAASRSRSFAQLLAALLLGVLIGNALSGLDTRLEAVDGGAARPIPAPADGDSQRVSQGTQRQRDRLVWAVRPCRMASRAAVRCAKHPLPIGCLRCPWLLHAAAPRAAPQVSQQQKQQQQQQQQQERVLGQLAADVAAIKGSVQLLHG
jgi:hypothetical protein